jgi:hypothetical protein
LPQARPGAAQYGIISNGADDIIHLLEPRCQYAKWAAEPQSAAKATRKAKQNRCLSHAETNGLHFVDFSAIEWLMSFVI